MTARRPISPCAALAVILLAAGCGAQPPQAPPRQAAELDTALSGISTACGLAYQVSAFAPPPAAQLAALATTARADAAKLDSVLRENPRWIYQGETVRTIAAAARAMLGACGLPAARRALARPAVR